MKNSTDITSRLDPDNSATLVGDERTIDENFSSKKQAGYVVRRNEQYSLSQLPYETVQKELKLKAETTYELRRNIVVVSR